MIVSRRALLFLIPILMSVLGGSFRAAVAAGRADCAELLSQSQDAAAEPALVEAAWELLVPIEQLNSSGLRAWFRQTSGVSLEDLLVPPLELAGPEVREALGDLLRIIEGLVELGSVDPARFTLLFRERLEEKFTLAEAGEGIGAEAIESREKASAAIRVVPVGSEVRHPPVELASGSLVVVGRHGQVIFFDREGGVIASHWTSDLIENPPVPLRDGGALVQLLDQSILHFASDGRLLSTFKGPPMAVNGLPLVLRDGSVIYMGDQGETLILNSDGSVRSRFNTGHWVTVPPIQLVDGMILFATMKGEIVRMDHRGNWKIQHVIHSGVAMAPVQLRDRTIVVADHRGVIHFLESDGRPKKKWRVFNVTYAYPGRQDDFALVALPDGRVAASSWTAFVILESDGRVLYETGRSAGNEFPPLLLEDGSLLVEVSRNTYARFAGSGWRMTSSFRIDDLLSAPLSSLGGGWIAAPGLDHRLRILEVGDRGARVVHDYAAGTDLRCKVIRLRNGWIAVGEDSGRVLLLDPAHLDSL